MCSSHNHIIAVLAYHRSINTTTKYGGHILNHKTPFLMESILIIRRTSGRERKVETCNNESAARGDKRYQQLEEKKCNRVSCSSYCRWFRYLNTYIGYPRRCDRSKWICYNCSCNCYRNCCR
ncbi:uncharacterized protein LOC114323009 isoform X2 [Camellia sinensis]|uniref:uncharacterized protein LOC114323009 isoform X2 n=1 Tax=Camellia sinensis TaxID=4442 RepID=UPI0010367BA6|nr:uncharacterized protein LOC114323009 isoform X2 [Camellia sinensis]